MRKRLHLVLNSVPLPTFYALSILIGIDRYKKAVYSEQDDGEKNRPEKV